MIKLTKLIKLIKSFLYNNSCVLCVWARYCVFFIIGSLSHKLVGFYPIVLVALLLTLILLLKLVNTNENLRNNGGEFISYRSQKRLNASYYWQQALHREDRRL